MLVAGALAANHCKQARRHYLAQIMSWSTCCSGGVIREEAETKAGGEAKLDRAVADGRVMVEVVNGHDMYKFPRVGRWAFYF